MQLKQTNDTQHLQTKSYSPNQLYKVNYGGVGHINSAMSVHPLETSIKRASGLTIEETACFIVA